MKILTRDGGMWRKHGLSCRLAICPGVSWDGGTRRVTQDDPFCNVVLLFLCSCVIGWWCHEPDSNQILLTSDLSPVFATKPPGLHAGCYGNTVRIIESIYSEDFIN